MEKIIQQRQKEQLALIQKLEAQKQKAAADKCLELWLNLKSNTI